MDYDERVTGGVAPAVAAAVYVGSAVVSALISMYGDKGEKAGQPVDTAEIAEEYAIKMVEKSKQDDPEHPITINEARQYIAQNPKLIEKVSGSVKKHNVEVTDKRGILQKFTEDVKGAQKSAHRAVAEAVAFSWKWPVLAVKSALGYKEEEEQIADDKQKLKNLGYTDKQINTYLQKKYMGRGEGISKLTIAKLIILVIIIICIMASAATGSNTLLGLAFILMLPLGGIFAYDYFANGQLV